MPIKYCRRILTTEDRTGRACMDVRSGKAGRGKRIKRVYYWPDQGRSVLEALIRCKRAAVKAGYKVMIIERDGNERELVL